MIRFYIGTGSDSLLKLFVDPNFPGDNQIDLADYADSQAVFFQKANALGGAGTAERMWNSLTATPDAQSGFLVTANDAYYDDVLKLLGKLYLSHWKPEGPDATYISYNMGVGGYNALKASMSSTQNYPERGRLSFLQWALQYEIRNAEWSDPRSKASKFQYARKIYEKKLP